MTAFLLIDGALLGLALLSLAVFRDQKFLNRLVHFTIIVAMTSGIVFSVQTFQLPDPTAAVLFAHSHLGTIALRFDKLSLFFLGLIQAGGIVSSLYGIGYLSHYETTRTLKPTLSSTVLLFLSMQVIAAADHVFLFLVAWEAMALSGYLGIILEREDKNVQRGSLVFFIATHIGTLFLYCMFLFLHAHTGSWEFSAFARSSYLPSAATTVFWLGFAGFGMKAGFMPFHFWLPEAHPVAPSHISAILSAVMLKTGIYGIVRVIVWINSTDTSIPAALLVISSITAIFGIWNALAQKDLKRMLAYSSIENIGIIGIALALMIFGMQSGKPLLIFLGLTGTLFHTVNHFVFKSLLFLGAGTIYHHYHHRNIERMGGLIKSAPTLGVLLLIGSAAICGLPPFNGFASEFMLYSGFFEAAHSLQAYFPFFMLISAVALAFVGGLAVVAFSKVFSLIFLGSEKTSSPHTIRISRYEFISLSILAFCVVLFGLFPQLIVSLTESIFMQLFPALRSAPPHSAVSTIQSVGVIAIASILLAAVVLIAKMNVAQRHSVRTSAPWGCGYSTINPRMQYTGTSFSDEIVNIAGKALYVEKEISLPEELLPQQSSFRTIEGDYVLHKIILPVNSGLSRLMTWFTWLQSGKIQVYVTFSVVILVFYILLAFQL